MKLKPTTWESHHLHALEASGNHPPVFEVNSSHRLITLLYARWRWMQISASCKWCSKVLSMASGKNNKMLPVKCKIILTKAEIFPKSFMKHQDLQSQCAGHGRIHPLCSTGSNVSKLNRSWPGLLLNRSSCSGHYHMCRTFTAPGDTPMLSTCLTLPLSNTSTWLRLQLGAWKHIMALHC